MIGFISSRKIRAPTVISYSSTSYAVASSTTETIPSTAKVGDLLIACVMHRSTLTPPAGWSLVAEKSISYPQTTAIYTKKCGSGDIGASTLWSQTASARLSVHIIVVRSSISTKLSAVNFAENVANSTMLVAEIVATKNKQLAIAVSSSLLASSGADTQIATPAGWTQTTPFSLLDNRLVAGYKVVNAGDYVSGSFFNSSPTSANANSWASVTILIG